MKKILITDPVDKKCAGILQENGFDVRSAAGIQPEELKKIISSYNALIVRSETKVDSSLISLMDNMEVIGRAGAGVDNIDVNAATRKGILVMNTPGGNTISAAEHTMALLLSLTRNIPQAAFSMNQSKWERKKFTGSELFGKTIFIVGLGKIGKEVAIRASAFGMNVIAYDPVIHNTPAVLSGSKIEFTDFEEGLKTADYITLHVPLSELTKNMINSDTLAICKDGVRIINCARGGIVNENDILVAVETGKVAGAAFDVFEKEPPDFSGPLFRNPKIICTPHLGASTEEAQEKVAVQIAEQITLYFREKNFGGAVNTPFTSIDKKLVSFLSVSVKTGYLQSKMLRGTLKEIRISLSGEFLHFNADLVNSAVLQGFLADRMDQPVNLINAGLILKESGVVLSVVKNFEDQNFSSLIETLFITTEGERLISGTVFGIREERIVQIDDELVEFNPAGNFLIYYNEDKPGVLAAVSKILAGSGINISGVSLGRKAETKKALSIIGVDDAPDEDVMKRITRTDGILDVYKVEFKGAR